METRLGFRDAGFMEICGRKCGFRELAVVRDFGFGLG